MAIITYDQFVDAFLAKISEFELLRLCDYDRAHSVDGYLHRAVAAFRKNCKYALSDGFNDELRQFEVEVDESDIDELVEILSEGMVVQWLKPYVRQQELLQNAINTRDFTIYSPANLLKQVTETYNQAQHDFVQMIREYSYNHGDLSSLHL